MAKLTRDKPALKVVDDQRGRSTSAEHLARTALDLLDRGARGTFHVTDGGECTWYEFTVEIANLLGRTCNRSVHHRRVPATGATTGLQRARSEQDRSAARPDAELARKPCGRARPARSDLARIFREHWDTDGLH